jgi:hypothetical protein
MLGDRELDSEKMISQLLQMAVALGWTPPGDVIDEITAGGVLITTQAADICSVTKSTIHRWLEDAAAKGRPLGVLTPAGYLIGLTRLLEFIEADQDYQARVKAKVRAEKYANVWSQPQLSLEKAGA